MLQVEPAISGVRCAASATPVSRPQSRSSTRGLASPSYAKSPPQRFEFDNELTFSPKLNDTSVKLVRDRRDSDLSQRPRSRSEAQSRSCDEFTFRPQMSTASLKIAQGLGTTFMARQEMHLEKQKKLLEQSKQLTGRLSPVTKTKKTKDKENSDNAAWGTPISTPNLVNRRRSSSHSPLDSSESSHDFRQSESTSMLDSQLNPLRGGRTIPPMQSSINLQRISQTSSPYAPGSSLLLNRQKSIVKDKSPRLHRRSFTHPAAEGRSNDSGNDSDTPGHPSASTHLRNKSPDPPSPRTRARVMAGQGSGPPSGERLKVAKLIAEKAIRKNKVFMIQGPYPVVRECLRKRDWVEKQYRAMAPHKYKKAKNDSDDDSDDDDDDNDNGCHGGSDVDDETGLDDSDSAYGIMSRIVRNHAPSFIWTVKGGAVDYKFLKKDAYVNHFPKNGAFTTKVGLCINLRSLARFGTVDPDSFFPRCYKICSEEEKNAFVDDYRLTAACSIVKWVIQRHNGELDIPMDDNEDDEEEEAGNEGGAAASEGNSTRPKSTTNSPTAKSTINTPRKAVKAKKNKAILGSSLIERAIKVIDYHFSILDHEDIDWPLNSPPIMSDEEWDQFIKEYYQLIHDGSIIQGSANYVDQCSSIINRLRASKVQSDMEGLRNIWIVKPGAKSRGRGITCMNKLEEIVKLVGSAIVQKEGKWVVQKYIERPLLIYDTKFDIRQWFLITDWNPLTVWFYKSSYLRFCGQIFCLDKFDSAIHLSNQSIQKNYGNCPTRSRMLPEDNMWTSEEFDEYLQKRGCGNVWQDVVYPGMKNAVIAAMESCQDVLDPRKGCFELYGADFMLTEDFHPWLIEINSSPAMGATTGVTEKMCYDVIEDTMKVVLDRKYDKNCDTGDFELAFKQVSVPQPQYIGQALAVEGCAVRKPLNRMKSSPNLVNAPKLSPRKCLGEPTRSRTTVTKTVSASDDPSLARATNLEDMKKKLAVYFSGATPRGDARRSRSASSSRPPPHKSFSSAFPSTESAPQPSNSGTITPNSQGDSKPHKSTSGTTLIDVAWGRTCGRCGNGAGVKLSPDQADAKCPCRKDNLLVPTPFIQSPGKPLKPSFKVQEPIPRSGAFISNRKGEFVSLNGSDPIQGIGQGIQTIGRAGFMQGKVKPNLNRHRRNNRIILETVDPKILPGPFKHAVSNSLGR